ncbi:MAG: tetratricopeptide repeat protein [Schwartzia sp.]|nr:tetratricopeptide repeat protein [Schwartzia sp. (in: firmicutes)]
MRFKKAFCKMFAAAIAAGTFGVMPLVSAEVKEYEGFGEYVMSDFETPDVAKQRAKARAEQNAMEQAGVYVESYTKVINHQVTHDEIATMTNGILKVKDVQYGKMTPTEDGKGILICVTIKADIDTDDINKWLSQNKQNVNELVEQNKMLQQAKDEQDKKIAELQKQIVNARFTQERNAIQEKFNSVDTEFLSNKKVEDGYRLLLNGDRIGAIVALSQAVELNPQNASAYSFLGIEYAKSKDQKRAIENCDKAIKLDPSNALTYSARGWAYAKLGDYTKAIADCTKAIELNPRFAGAYSTRGLVYSFLGDYSMAIADCTNAIALNSKDASGYRGRGYSYLNLRNYVYAIADFTESIKYEPQNAEAFYFRGRAYQQIGDNAKANADFAKARDLGLKF